MDDVSGSDARRRDRFVAVFESTHEPLQQYVSRRGGSSVTGDVVAEALTVLWRRLDDVPEGLERAWAFSIARRCLANARRTTMRQDRLVNHVAAELRVTNLEPIETGLDAELDTAMATLSEDDRELLRLSVWEALAPREIAVVLDLSPNAVSIRLHRARQQLKKLLADRKITSCVGHEHAKPSKEVEQ
jgi:RNA polymerase sigma-70 factor, ECF subfamily